MQELLKSVTDDLLKESAQQFPDVPSELHRDYAVAGGWGGFVAGAGVGAHIGAGLGIAAGPLGAIAGTVPGALVGGVIGYFGGNKLGSQFSKD